MTHAQPYVGMVCDTSSGLVEILRLTGVGGCWMPQPRGDWQYVGCAACRPLLTPRDGGATQGQAVWVPVQHLQPCYWPEEGEP